MCYYYRMAQTEPTPNHTIKPFTPLPERRRCPQCMEQFIVDISPARRGRPPTYCTDCAALPKHAKDITKRVCPFCDITFHLTPGQAAATAFCTPIHKTAFNRMLQHTRGGRTCLLPGCHAPASNRSNTNNRTPVYCTPAHARQHYTTLQQNRPERLLCQNPTCPTPTTPTPWKPSDLTLPPKFCSSNCRDKFFEAAYQQLPPDQRPQRTTRRRSYKNVRLEGQVSVPMPTDPAQRKPWHALRPTARQAYERDGWTAETWATYAGPYSPAALAWAVHGEPQHVPLHHLKVQNIAANLPKLPTDLTHDIWDA